MKNEEKMICEVLLAEGNIINKEVLVSGEGIEVESYEVEYNGEKYAMTKNNGEWVYFYHC